MTGLLGAAVRRLPALLPTLRPAASAALATAARRAPAVATTAAARAAAPLVFRRTVATTAGAEAAVRGVRAPLVRPTAKMVQAPACDRPLPPAFPPVAVIGGGNLGVTSAAYIEARGGDSSLYIRPSARGQGKLDTLESNGNVIKFTPPDARAREVQISRVTGDMGDAIEGRPVIMITTPADGHPEVAELLAPRLMPGATIILHPGQTFGAFTLVRELEKAGIDPDILKTVTIAEFGTSVFTTRSSVENAEYSAIKAQMLFSVFPAVRTREVLPLVHTLFPTTRIRVLEDSLAMSFHAIAAAPHTVITLTRLGDLARQENYEYYIKGVDHLNVKLIRAFDEERCAITRRWGYEPVSVETCLREMYEPQYARDPDSLGLQELFNENPAYKGYGSPKDLSTRYFTEEMPTGVLPMLELARRVGEDTPVMSSVATLLEALYKDTSYDFQRDARSLDKLGLGGLTVEQLRTYAQTGELPEDARR